MSSTCRAGPHDNFRHRSPLSRPLLLLPLRTTMSVAAVGDDLDYEKIWREFIDWLEEPLVTDTLRFSQRDPDEWYDLLEMAFYEVLFHLDVETVIRMRRVCKFFYYMTHRRALWAHLLLQTHYSQLPPLAPVPNPGRLLSGVPVTFSAAELERILVRSASLRKNWDNNPNPRPLDVWFHDTLSRVLDLCLLPGSEYLLAALQNKKTGECNITLYHTSLLCGHNAEAVMAIPMKGEPVNGTLKAQYMTVGRVPGLAVTCMQKICGVIQKADGSAVDHYTYDCMAGHLCLDTLDQLNRVSNCPDMSCYDEVRAALPAAFSAVTMPPPLAEQPLCAPALGLLYAKPYVAYIRRGVGGRIEICLREFERFEDGEPVLVPVPEKSHSSFSALHCANSRYVVTSLQIMSDQRSLLLVRRLYVPNIEEPLHRVDRLSLDDYIPHDPHTLLAPSHIFMHRVPCVALGGAYTTEPQLIPPAQYSLYNAAGVPEPRSDCPPPAHVYACAPVEFDLAGPLCPLTHGYFPDLDLPQGLAPWTAWPYLPGSAGVRVLPGAQRPVVCKVLPTGELLSICPLRDGLGAPDFWGNGALVDEVRNVVDRLAIAGAAGSPSVLAWDDSVGRLVTASPNTSTIRVLEFAKAPSISSLTGDRWPLPVRRAGELREAPLTCLQAFTQRPELEELAFSLWQKHACKN
ncbi:hypothetical protein BD413DRAFT_68823 [Trametes elegans]|nr:hypothetical protein BD413DRAFT_68823 [Trametes elegans]